VALSEKQKMLSGALYDASDPELVADRTHAQQVMRAYNATIDAEVTARHSLLDQLIGSYGTPCELRAPFYVDYGRNIHLGRGVFMNFGCVLLDVCEIRIGDGTEIGPYVQILTADHPRDPAARASGREFGRPITIGAQVWIGGGAIILPGVTIGDGATIGAGAIVTRDVAAGATVAGNPARPITTGPTATAS